MGIRLWEQIFFLSVMLGVGYPRLAAFVAPRGNSFFRLPVIPTAGWFLIVNFIVIYFRDASYGEGIPSFLAITLFLWFVILWPTPRRHTPANAKEEEKVLP